LKSLTNLREAFFVFLALTVIALFNAGQAWERQEISMHYATLEINQMLSLDDTQVDRIRAIYATCEAEIARTRNENSKSGEEKLRRLLNERNKLIMEVLNENQKRILHAYCTALVSSTKDFE
jgi:hypothetical protein